MAAAAAAEKGPVVVVDNYDSFTYNLCQVRAGGEGCCSRVASMLQERMASGSERSRLAGGRGARSRGMP